MNNVRPQLKMLTDEQIQEIHKYTMQVLATYAAYAGVAKNAAAAAASTYCWKARITSGSSTAYM